ncbi:WD40 repeat domain-containing protein [Nordella sp. HKS 07]|uniref:WD40 repeat domain-containing protein n=1 Tax=Nordella sp. HKS 07 TaxID=2712222 RepID=UPI0013E13770|nr:WD40 repeat domain-containing protein [Nordella sp. HKS 07]QIG48916.1 WD40 repeat domain-containing protein [Nordella sp. HKS 07]
MTLLARIALIGLLVSFASETVRADDPSPDAARDVQTTLGKLGYLRSEATGKWDKTTIEAAMRFASEVELPLPLISFGADRAILRKVLAAEGDRRTSGRDIFLAPNGPSRWSDDLHLSEDGATALTGTQSSIVIWNAATGRPLRVLYDHCCVTAASLSGDGKLAAFIDNESTVRMVDTATGKFAAVFTLAKGSDGSDRDPSTIRFMPSNDAVVIADDEGSITLHPLTGGKSRLVGNHIPPKEDPTSAGEIKSLSVSGDGKLVASLSAYDGKLKIWNLAKGKLQREVKLFPENKGGDAADDSIGSTERQMIAFDSKGASITVAALRIGNDFQVITPVIQKIDVASGKVSRIDAVPVVFAAASAGGLLAASDPRAGEVSLYDMSSLEKTAAVKSNLLVNAIDAGGRRALAQVPANEWSYEGNFVFFDMAAGTTVATPTLKAEYINRFAVNDENKTAYLGVFEDKLASLSLVTGEVSFIPLKGLPPAEAGKPALSLRALDLVSGKIIDREDIYVPARGQESETPPRVLSIDPGTGNVDIRGITTPPVENGYYGIVGTALSADGRFAVNGYQRERESEDAEAFVSIVDVSTGKEKANFPFYPQTHGAVGLTCLWFGTVCKQRSLQTTHEIARNMFGYATDITFTGSGKYVLAGYWEPAISAIDAETGEIATIYNTSLTYEKWGIPAKKVGPGLGKKDGWDPEVAEAGARGASVPRLVLPLPASDDFLAVLESDFGSKAFMLRFSAGRSDPSAVIEIPARADKGVVSPDGNLVALGYAGGLILILDVETGNIRSTLYDNHGLPGTLRFSADSRRLYSISTIKYSGQTADGAFRIWDTANGDLLASTHVFANGEWITLTPEGFYTGTAAAGRKVAVRLGEKESVPEADVARMLHRPDLVAARLAGESKEKLAAAAASLAFK